MRSEKRRAKPATPVPNPPAEGPKLGECLRHIRYERKLTLTDVSTLTGIAKSTLSRVESDQLSLTYDKLLQLCRGLQIDLATLIDAKRGSKRELGRRVYTPAGKGRSVVVNLQAYHYLCTELAGKKMTPMVGIIESRNFAETNGLLNHDGEEFTYVLEGTLELHTALYEPLVLEAGGSVYFDSTMGHAYVSIGEAPCKILCVCSTPEPVLVEPAPARRSEPASSRPRARGA